MPAYIYLYECNKRMVTGENYQIKKVLGEISSHMIWKFILH